MTKEDIKEFNGVEREFRVHKNAHDFELDNQGVSIHRNSKGENDYNNQWKDYAWCLQPLLEDIQDEPWFAIAVKKLQRLVKLAPKGSNIRYKIQQLLDMVRVK